jgi:hypothetical protein
MVGNTIYDQKWSIALQPPEGPTPQRSILLLFQAMGNYQIKKFI